jgi:hypothetical protein
MEIGIINNRDERAVGERDSGKSGEASLILRRLQNLRLGQLQVGGKTVRSLMNGIPKELTHCWRNWGVIKLFALDWVL